MFQRDTQKAKRKDNFPSCSRSNLIQFLPSSSEFRSSNWHPSSIFDRHLQTEPRKFS